MLKMRISYIFRLIGFWIFAFILLLSMMAVFLMIIGGAI